MNGPNGIWASMLGPLAGMVIIAALAGISLAWLSRPKSDTRIITTFAEAYRAETGGHLTDCEARPSPVDTIRIVIVCSPDVGEPVFYVVDDWGGLVDYPGLVDAMKNET